MGVLLPFVSSPFFSLYSLNSIPLPLYSYSPHPGALFPTLSTIWGTRDPSFAASRYFPFSFFHLPSLFSVTLSPKPSLYTSLSTFSLNTSFSTPSSHRSSCLPFLPFLTATSPLPSSSLHPPLTSANSPIMLPPRPILPFCSLPFHYIPTHSFTTMHSSSPPPGCNTAASLSSILVSLL